MLILVLKFGDEEVQMPSGESFIGRALDCQLRFNEATVSRRHLRIICRKDEAHIENLSMTNETLLNSQPIGEPCRLRHGDEIQIAHKILKVRMVEQAEHVGPDFTSNEYFEDPLASLEDWDEQTIRKIPKKSEDLQFDISTLDRHNCPKCRALVEISEPLCSNCGYQWPSPGPARRTQKIQMPQEKLREDRRHIVRVPVIYSSDDLTLDVVARDLGRGGMFLASEILEPVGTECHVTALPDGRPALHFNAVVCHVSTESVSGRPPGFGVKFNSLSSDAQQWLDVVTRKKTEVSEPKS